MQLLQYYYLSFTIHVVRLVIYYPYGYGRMYSRESGDRVSHLYSIQNVSVYKLAVKCN